MISLIDEMKWLQAKMLMAEPMLKIRVPRWFRYWMEDDVAKHLPQEAVLAHKIPRSKEANKALDEAGIVVPDSHNGAYSACKRLKLVWEHCVPLSFIYEKLFECRHSPEKMCETVQSLYRMAWITKDEDNRISRLGMRSLMPHGWDGTNPYARYTKSSISLDG